MFLFVRLVWNDGNGRIGFIQEGGTGEHAVDTSFTGKARHAVTVYKVTPNLAFNTELCIFKLGKKSIYVSATTKKDAICFVG